MMIFNYSMNLIWISFIGLSSAANVIEEIFLQQKDVKKNPFDILKHEKRYSKFVAAIERFPDILHYLKCTKDNVTIFAPTDEAFGDLKSDTSTKWRQILQYHISNDSLGFDDLNDGALISTNLELESLSNTNQKLKVLERDREYYIGTDSRHTKISLEDKKEFPKGAIFSINNLLIPPSSLVDQPLVAEITQSLWTFYMAIQHAGLEEIYKNMQGLTIFAPTDDAFALLGDEIIDFLFSAAGKLILQQMLYYHIIPPQENPIYTMDMKEAGGYYRSMFMGKTIQCKKLKAAEKSLIIVNQKSSVVYQDVLGSNGVMHVVDRVLLPFSIPQYEK